MNLFLTHLVDTYIWLEMYSVVHIFMVNLSLMYQNLAMVNAFTNVLASKDVEWIVFFKYLVWYSGIIIVLKKSVILFFQKYDCVKNNYFVFEPTVIQAVPSKRKICNPIIFFSKYDIFVYMYKYHVSSSRNNICWEIAFGWSNSGGQFPKRINIQISPAHWEN